MIITAPKFDLLVHAKIQGQNIQKKVAEVKNVNSSEQHSAFCTLEITINPKKYYLENCLEKENCQQNPQKSQKNQLFDVGPPSPLTFEN